MTRWTIDTPRDLTFDEVRALSTRIVAGHVDVVATKGRPRLEVTEITGPPLVVTLADGRLTVTYEDLAWDGVLGWLLPSRRRAAVSLAVPEDAPVELGVVSASAVVSGIAGRTAVRSVSGPVTLDGLSKRVDAQTVSGDVEARSLDGSLGLVTVSGDLTVTSGTSERVKAKTVSGRLTLDLDLAPGGRIELGSVSGSVTVRLPETVGVNVDFGTATGQLGTGFEGLHRESVPGHASMRGKIGDGRGRLSAKTVSGDIALLRRTADTHEMREPA